VTAALAVATIARSDAMKKSSNKPTKAGAVELTEDELGDVAGGLVVKLEDCLISSYSISSGGDRPTESVVRDPTLDPQLKR
jgi:hypothetical protein